MIFKTNVALAGLFMAGIAFTACNGNGKTNSADSTAATDSNSKNIMVTTPATLPAAAGFETTVDGKKTALFILKNKKGLQAAITNFGGRLVGLLVPDNQGKMTDVVIGFDGVQGYQGAADAYYGALIGRYGNRIGNAKFSLEGKEYTLPANNGKNTLHGGKAGFDVQVWDAKQLNDHSLQLNLTSKDGDQGFPGNLSVKVVYDLTDDNSLKISYEATTDKATVVNLTNHAYWNLNGCNGGTILNHKLEIEADNYTPVDAGLIPTGVIAPVKGTPFDFRTATEIGARIGQQDEQLKNGTGYDHNFALNPHDLKKPITSIAGDKTGITMEVYTEEPGIQFYTGNFMKGAHTIYGGAKDGHRTGFCLETQHFPDAPNKPKFESTELKPSRTYRTTTIYKFLVK